MIAKISLALNIILLALVANLYMNNDAKDEAPVSENSSSTSSFKVAYLNTDSLDVHYEFANAIRADLEKEAAKKQRRLERKAEKAQQEFNNLQASAQYMTPSQLQVAQQRAVQMEQEIQMMQAELAEEFAIEQAEMQQKLIDKLDSFLVRYNDTAHFDYIIKKHIGSQILLSNPSYDITDEVLELLNAEYLGTDAVADSTK